MYIGTLPDPLGRWENKLAEDVALVRALKTYLIHRLMASGVLRLATLVFFLTIIGNNPVHLEGQLSLK